jgi:tetratricopeptide (TPR) repeat protein
MKRLVGVLFIAAALIGCGGPKQAKQAAVQKRDFVAEGFELLKQGQVVPAIKSFDEAIREDPRNPDKYLTLAEVYFNLKYYVGAMDTVNAALKLDPTSAKAYYLYAVSAYLTNDPQNRTTAEEAIKRAMTLYLANKDRENFEKSRQLYLAISGQAAQQAVTDAAAGTVPAPAEGTAQPEAPQRPVPPELPTK